MTPEEKTALAKLREAKDPSARYSAIIAIGKAGMTSLATEVAAFLHDDAPELRSAAIRTLAFYWQLPPYRGIAETMMREEPDEETRAVAIMGWAAYDYYKRVPATLKRLYQILIDDNEPAIVRSSAYNQFFGVYLPDGRNHPKSPMSIDRSVEDGMDWDRLNAVMAETKAAAPSVDALRAAKSVEYRDARTTVKLRPDRFELARDTKAVDGEMNPELWKQVVGALELAQFPAPPAPREGDVYTLTCEREGMESLVVPAASTKYRDVLGIANVIIDSALGGPGNANLPKLAVTSIEFGCGNPEGLYGGRLTLTVQLNEQFTMRYVWHENAQLSTGMLVAGTFTRLLERIEATGFPQAEPVEGLVPGTEVSDIGVLDHGTWRRVDFVDSNPRFAALNDLVYTIISQVDRRHAQPGPKDPQLVLTVTRDEQL